MFNSYDRMPESKGAHIVSSGAVVTRIGGSTDYRSSILQNAAKACLRARIVLWCLRFEPL